ncbi:MAG: polynucleotide adenylyltransferase PcnB, partial [Acidobacteria bacterium]|nr:polynucleotide adenylyltransferase PcnB [Acidobacteriota bacterium]
MTESSEPARTDLAPAQEIPAVFPAERLDADAVRIVERLADAGFEAYLVGGCVRDLLFGLRPKDFDIATSAHPNEVRRLFRNCRIIGRRFRLAHLHFRDKIVEVATFRAGASEPTEENGDRLIREDNVFGTAAEDAFRRDFTWNALFYDVRRQVILDFVGGVGDVERRVLRTIGDPELRMAEDPIRILRALRLAARLGCTLDAPTWRAIVARREDILRAAAPRILEDLLRMFRGGAVAPAFDLMRESGVLEVVLPELAQHLARAAEQGRTEELEALRAALRQTDRLTVSGRAFAAPVQLAVLLAEPAFAGIEAARTRGQRGVHVDPAPVVVEMLRGLSQR